jgi:N-acetylneuraminate synthase
MYVKKAGYATYINKKKPIYQIIKEMEVPYDWLPKLKNYCDKRNITFLCTPFDETSVDHLNKIGIEAYKIASYSINHIPLIQYIAKKGKPIIMSTGASYLLDISRAIKIIKENGNDKIALMQCTAKYPAPLSILNLKVIPELIKKFKMPVGLSDHSREPIIAPLGAVALGANMLEKHFTTNNDLPGPDHKFAILAPELIEMIASIRKLEMALGRKEKRVLTEEKELYDFARQYIYAKKDILKGEILTKENMIILRSGQSEKGLEPSKYYEIMGKKTARYIKKGHPITKRCVLYE